METSTHERGRFYIGPNGFPRFAGSSSGVYLADTVQSDLTSQDHPTPDPGIEDAFMQRNNDEPRSDETALYDIYLLRTKDLLEEETLRTRLNRYFATWHPLFPFLDGAYLLQCFNNSLNLAKIHHTVIPLESIQDSQISAFEGLTHEQSLALTTIFLVVFTIGGLGLIESGNGLNSSSKVPQIHSTSQATMLGHLIVGACQNSRINDLFGIQALLAIELLFYVTRTFRPAMHLSGVIAKLAFEAGLHRCPERFPATFTDPADRNLRKRVFYSLYVLDRLLSADFGIPLMLNDSDIDTCVPGGAEKHSTPETHRQDNVQVGPPASEGAVPHSNQSQVGPQSSDGRGTKRKSQGDPRDEAISPPTLDLNTLRVRARLLPAHSLSLMAKMVGQAMEQFNKSVSHRVIDANEVLHLRSDLDAWWNDIGLDCDVDVHASETPADPRRHMSTLFTCLYHSQIVNLNRPALSLPPSQIQHDHALQAAIASVRKICATLSDGFLKNADDLWWPGYVDIVFLGSLILVYGARRERSRHGQATWLTRDLRRALSILEYLTKRWPKSDKFSRVVKSLIDRESPADTSKTDDVEQIITAAASSEDPAPEAMSFNIEDCFHFDFDTFALEPESIWAYHVSMPPSPVL
uniref:Xylanolytic transcriptional activator regulatory domain-containing protein n=1 Tax=Kwoniella bestiolae CBS 10118 TaxID=1296100 RepID=A0A1B9FX36_9TREE|nr:hypothetical protein I302_07687 [Kwoniella bestiolae CBS 10118]OCF23333.1 hypothetical protein I302_07687 [Kwoniella bestiolae CBS 10118]